MHGDTFDPSQNNVLGNLHSKASHARDEHVGVLHALHGIVAQHIAAQEHKVIRDTVAASHPTRLRYRQGGVCVCVCAWTETYSCLEYSPSSISASLPFLAIPCKGDNRGGRRIVAFVGRFERERECADEHHRATRLTLAGVWDSSVLTEFEEELWDSVFVSVPDKRRFLDSGELDIYRCTGRYSINFRSKIIKITKIDLSTDNSALDSSPPGVVAGTLGKTAWRSQHGQVVFCFF